MKGKKDKGRNTWVAYKGRWIFLVVLAGYSYALSLFFSKSNCIGIREEDVEAKARWLEVARPSDSTKDHSAIGKVAGSITKDRIAAIDPSLDNKEDSMEFACEVDYQTFNSYVSNWTSSDVLPPQKDRRKIWSAIVMTSAKDDRGCPKNLINILRTSKVYDSSVIAPELKPPIRLVSTATDEGAPLVLREAHEDSYGYRKRFSKEKTKTGVVIDLGSNLGATIIMMARSSSRGLRILSVEAMPITWLYQNINLWINVREDMENGKISTALAALGDQDGKRVKFQFRADSLTSSRDWNPKSEDHRTTMEVSLVTKRLDSLLAAHNILETQPIILLKLDCEGCEYDVIPGMGENMLNRTLEVAGETHIGDMLRSGRKPSRDKVVLTHGILCERWQIYCDPVPDY